MLTKLISLTSSFLKQLIDRSTDITTVNAAD
jgi:hypothetical protein